MPTCEGERTDERTDERTNERTLLKKGSSRALPENLYGKTRDKASAGRLSCVFCYGGRRREEDEREDPFEKGSSRALPENLLGKTWDKASAGRLSCVFCFVCGIKLTVRLLANKRRRPCFFSFPAAHYVPSMGWGARGGCGGFCGKPALRPDLPPRFSLAPQKAAARSLREPGEKRVCATPKAYLVRHGGVADGRIWCAPACAARASVL